MNTVSSASQPRQRTFPWRLILQVFTAIVGGYLFANVLAIFFAKVFPDIRAYAVAYGLLLSFLYWTMAIMWVFAHRSLRRGCGGLWLATAILAGLSWGLTQIGVAA